MSNISREAKHLIGLLLVKDPALRVSEERVVAHAWLQQQARGKGGGRDMLCTLQRFAQADIARKAL